MWGAKSATMVRSTQTRLPTNAEPIARLPVAEMGLQIQENNATTGPKTPTFFLMPADSIAAPRAAAMELSI